MPDERSRVDSRYGFRPLVLHTLYESSGMKKSNASRVISIRTLNTQPLREGEWHQHSFHELCLLAEDSCTIRKSRSEMHLSEDTLLYFAPNEFHGYWNSATESPRFWVLLFTLQNCLAERFTFLNKRGKANGSWKLTPAQSLMFRARFWQIFREHEQRHEFHQEAESDLLKLLVLEIERWRIRPDESASASLMPSPEVLGLWQAISKFEGPLQCLATTLSREFPNYDSLRHSFKQAFGCSPREQLQETRLRQAKSLLQDSSLSIGEVARQLGFEYQHDFSRSFLHQTGMSPTKWREGYEENDPVNGGP